MSQHRKGRNVKRAYLKQFSSDVIHPRGKAKQHSAKMLRKVLYDHPEGSLGLTDWGVDGISDNVKTGWPTFGTKTEADRKSRLIPLGGKLLADKPQRRKVCHTPHETIWMFFSGTRVYFIRLDHYWKRAQISNIWRTTTRALEALQLNLVSWQEDIDYSKAVKEEF